MLLVFVLQRVIILQIFDIKYVLKQQQKKIVVAALFEKQIFVRVFFVFPKLQGQKSNGGRNSQCNLSCFVNLILMKMNSEPEII